MRRSLFALVAVGLAAALLVTSPAGAEPPTDGPVPPAGSEASPAPAEAAAPEAVLVGARQVAVGYYHSCAVLTNSQVRCWGWNGDGELGNDSLTNQFDTAVVVKNRGGGGPLTGVRQLALGDSHSCGLLANGQVRCWGDNDNGQLGDGNGPTDARRPVVVRNPANSGPLQNVIQISAEYSGTCALLTSRKVVCWGDDDYGQIGNGGPLADRPFPTYVKGLGGAGHLTNVRSLGGGYDTNCAVLRNGQGRCWGYNDSGALGNGTLVGSPHPVVVQEAATGRALAGITQISNNGYHGCARLNNGQARCWGENDSGQLGIGSTTLKKRAVPVGGVGGGRLTGVIAIFAGNDHTCAQVTGGQARCWGDDSYGQNGDGTIESPTFRKRPTPVRNGNNTGNLKGITQMESKSYSACARLNNGRVRCWGYGVYGNLGDGSPVDEPLPVLVQI